MNLDDPKTEGYVIGTETFCCRGCAEGTGCTCPEPKVELPKAGNRRGHTGHRNPENNLLDANQNDELTASGRRLGRRKPAAQAPPRQHHRGDVTSDGRKVPRSQSEERPSTREQARGFREQRRNPAI